MGPVRSEVMWQAVLDAVACGETAPPLDVLDLGGGTGGDAVRLAQQGHRVTVVDPSPDALASLRRRSTDAGLDQSVTGVLGDHSDLVDTIEAESFDLVVCHGVLEHVDDPAPVLDALAHVLRPTGRLSVTVASLPAAALSKVMAGDFAEARLLVETPTSDWDVRKHGPRRFGSDQLQSLLAGHGFETIEANGLRVFADFVPSAVVDAEPGAREALFDLERLVRKLPEFTSLSGGLHVIACLDLTLRTTNRGGNSATL